MYYVFVSNVAVSIAREALYMIYVLQHRQHDLTSSSSSSIPTDPIMPTHLRTHNAAKQMQSVKHASYDVGPCCHNDCVSYLPDARLGCPRQ